MLIFDEAHNIEDVCREAASVEVDMQTMVEVCMGWVGEWCMGGCAGGYIC
jgi:Rad3-related DNA helicase